MQGRDYYLSVALLFSVREEVGGIIKYSDVQIPWKSCPSMHSHCTREEGPIVIAMPV